MAQKFTLYGNRGAASAERVRLMLLDVGFTDYKFVTLNFSPEELRGPEHLARNPFGRVPVLVMEDGFTLFEGRAICNFLARTYDFPLVPPSDDLRAWALFDQAQSIEVCYFSEFAGTISGELFAKPIFGLGEPDQNAVAKAKKAIGDWATGVEVLLQKQDKGFMAGKDFGLVDIYYIPMVHRLLDCGLGELFMKGNIKKWWERCLERENVKSWVDGAVTVERVRAMMAKRTSGL